MNREDINHDNIYDFISFYSRSRLYHDHNLKLAYLLINVKNCSLVEAAAVLKVSRTLFYTKVFPDNVAFLSKTVTVQGWGTGRSERRIKMSDETLTFSDMIAEYAKYHLGNKECQRIAANAKDILTGQTKANVKYQKRIETLRKNQHKTGHMQRVLAAAKDFHKTKDRVLKDIEAVE